MDGSVRAKDGYDYKYKLFYTIAGNTVGGCTVTTMLDGTELRTVIKGTIDKKEQKMHFKELVTPGETFVGACYFDVYLSWKLKDSVYSFEGTFTGTDSANNPCMEGYVYFDVFQAIDNVYELEKPVAKKSGHKKPAPISAEAETTHEEVKVTATIHQEFEWKSDSCILEIWDGEVVDGDIVTVLFNREMILEGYSLESAKKRIVLPMRRKTNVLEIIAENEGKAPPNTSKVSLSDGSSFYPLLSLLRKGDTATIVLKKK